ncbi:hypothetical protein MBRA1_003335 [Malassezia brasiliensis]|uniref:GRIP domain-containing protein n=1 Tax=Malassezia brasiliensis TaxID=1821822 RepID=A0AAF0DWC3_9BASI|nr:hypothetical protein MBRA1_003335 [Malassezia brasiliensis]
MTEPVQDKDPAPAHLAEHTENTPAPPSAPEEAAEPATGEVAGRATQSSNPEVLQAALAQVQEEKDALEAQYNTLLEKLAHMRTTVGERLRQDAEELDRREQQIERLTTQLGDLETTNVSLREELVASHAESERVTEEMDKLRAEVAKSAAQDTFEEQNRLEMRCRELQETVDAQRVDLDRYETSFREERAWREDMEAQAQRTDAALTSAREREVQLQGAVEQEKQLSRQLQQALEEFQLAQERDMRRTVGEMQDQVDKAEAALESHKLQLHDAESQLAAAQEAVGRCGALEQEVKEKNLLIGKLRHEAVILNEHLTEALRQVRRDSSGTMVDRRLVTNLVLQFLAVPRADSKRFEILKLMASVLQWDEEEREKAGLQRAHDRGGFRFFGFGGAKPPPSPSRSGTGDESVSNLFVEFLLSEVERSEKGEGKAPPPSAEGDAPFDLNRLAQLDAPASGTSARSADEGSSRQP